jgi:hypothetical protein
MVYRLAYINLVYSKMLTYDNCLYIFIVYQLSLS